MNTSVNSVTLNKTFNISCSAQANPAAKYRFYKNQEVLNGTSGKDIAVIPTFVRERVLKVNYSCTPFNEFGDGPTKVISVSVLCKYQYCGCYLLWYRLMYMSLCLTLARVRPKCKISM